MEKRMANNHNHHPHTMSSFHTNIKVDEYGEKKSSSSKDTQRFNSVTRDRLPFSDEEEEKESSFSRAEQRFNPVTSNRPRPPFSVEEEEKESSFSRAEQRLKTVTSNRPPFSVEEEEKESSSLRTMQRFNTVTSDRPPSSQLKPQVKFNEEDYESKRRANMILKRQIDIDQSAEDFINRFKQQLQIERLDSIENYKQYLERGL